MKRKSLAVIDHGRRTEQGVTLIELLIVVAIVGILSSLAVIGYNAVMGGAKEKSVSTKLLEIAEAQMQYRVGNGRKRYATLQELRTTMTAMGTPLINPMIAPADEKGNPAASQGWVIREPKGAPEGDALRSSFAIEAVPAEGNNSTNIYCLFEDGVLRLGSTERGCDLSSPPADGSPQSATVPCKDGVPCGIDPPLK